jgi:hypothetical protein
MYWLVILNKWISYYLGYNSYFFCCSCFFVKLQHRLSKWSTTWGTGKISMKEEESYTNWRDIIWVILYHWTVTRIPLFRLKSIKQSQNIRSFLNQPLNLSLLCDSAPSQIVSFVDNEDLDCKQLMEFVHAVIHPNKNSFLDMKTKLYRLR